MSGDRKAEYLQEGAEFFLDDAAFRQNGAAFRFHERDEDVRAE